MTEQRLASLQETLQKVETSLLEFSTDDEDGIDFLNVKNELLLQYLTDTVLALKRQMEGKTTTNHIHRLVVTQTALEKLRGLEKKLKYMIDKILSTSDAAAFADDPLQYKPLLNDDDEEEEENESDDDDDLQAAKQTVTVAKQKEVYQAPRMEATPYNNSNRTVDREKRERRKLKTSELAQTLRSQYGETPEQDDIHGGTEMGKQREAARRFQQKQDEKTKYEEEMFVRLQTTRKEKKEHKRIMRQEESNLAAIADLGNITRDSRMFSKDDRGDHDGILPDFDGRYANGKRKKTKIDKDGRPLDAKKKRSVEAKNSFQAQLFGNSRRKKK